MKKPLALIIDDEPDIRELLEITLTRMDIECIPAENLHGAYELLKNQKFDICLTDMRLPDGNGLELVSFIQETNPQLPVAVITAHGNMESAIQALKSGAFDFLSKPVDLDVLRMLVKTALRVEKQHRVTTQHNLIGDSQLIASTRETINKVARSQAPIYICGESGVGKELVAKMIHEQGPRAENPFVPINCGAIPHELLESELFGHKKGSFTGALSDKEGLMQAAEGGTLFFDEIAELPQHMQVKLLRAIQEKSIRPIGATSEMPINVRILSATHKDLNELVHKGTFRQDLYYRINVIELQVPPLRDRPEDIRLLVIFFLQQRIGDDKQQFTLSDEAMKKLKIYRFPGNVRELENILERAVTLCEGNIIGVNDLQLPESKEVSSSNKNGDMALDTYLDDIERQSIMDALEKTRWNKTKAAKLLGISFRALRYRLQKLDLDKE